MATLTNRDADSGLRCQWLRHGREALDAMLEAIRQAQHSVRLEMFIFRADKVGDAFRDALIAAQERGVRVRVMCDAVGSFSLPGDYWSRLIQAGGEFRPFNPVHLHRLVYRDHRKIIVVDDTIAFIGGLNIADEYCGDGVTCGWRDLGLRIEGPLVRELADAFNELFARADCRHRRFQRLRRARRGKDRPEQNWQLLLTGPGRGHRMLKQTLTENFNAARSIRIVCAYFLPGLRMLRALRRAARRGVPVQLILAGRSDVPLMRMATRSLYPALLRAGVQIYEFKPQILHAKMIIVDDVVFAGSANLDARSLGINYEVVVRLPDRELAASAREMFAEDLRHCQRIDTEVLRQSRTFWEKWVGRWALFFLARVDPYLARLQRRRLTNT